MNKLILLIMTMFGITSIPFDKMEVFLERVCSNRKK